MKINIKNQGAMLQLPLKGRIIYFTRNQNEDPIELLLANNSQSRQGKYLIQASRNSHHVVFESQGKTNITNLSYMTKVEIKCQEENNRVIVPHVQYQKIAREIQELEQEEQGSEIQESQNQMEAENQDDEQEEVKRGQAPKYGHQQYPISKDQQSSLNGLQQRGRGRPKGAKNKKTILKEALQHKETPSVDLKLSLNGSKRGKGRPKGSKNKIKDYTHPVKIQTGAETVTFGKRGKGRPKGSKNKIKMHSHMTVRMQSQKRKGRPPGSKNRAYSIESIQEDQQMEDQFVRMEIIRPQQIQVQTSYCCLRCDQSSIKRKIFSNETNVEQNIDSLKNVYEDVSLQNKSNLIITAIRLGDWQSLQQLLSIVTKTCCYHTSPWKTEHMIDRQKFQTKTKKEYLSKTGKEGNIVLLHDCFKKQQSWWKQITVQRIISNLPRQQPQTQYVIEKLLAADSQLRHQIFSNIASVVRSGNFSASEFLLRMILLTPTKNYLNFSQEHYDLLIGNLPLLNHLKKYNLVKHNTSPNFCSPIHTASISNNPEFLRKLLQIFTDILNVEDNLNRRPIHYASLSLNTQNLSILVESGADLKDYDINKMTPLMLACYEGMFYNVEYILQKVRDPNYINFKSQQGYTALHYAILQNNIECIQLLINDPYVDLWALTKDKGDIFHLLAGTGNTDIMDLILSKEVLPFTSQDKFKKTPSMIAIRNKNNDCLVKLIENGCKLQKVDSSLNSLLHYAAAYGNIEAIMILKDKQEQNKNKKGLYPWQLAIHKGHLGAAKLLQPDQVFDFVQDPLYFALSNIRGTAEYMQCIRYIKDKMMSDIEYQQKSSGNGYLHLICQTNEEEYLKVRKEETHLSTDQIKDEFYWIQNQLINMFVIQQGLNGYQENYFGQTPLKLCIQNNNLIGLQKLLTGKITFQIEPSSGNTILHCLSSLACRGLEELRFVQKKLKQCNVNELKVNVKKIDHNGFDFLLFFVKSFTENAVQNYQRTVKKHLLLFQIKKQTKSKTSNIKNQSEKKALEEFYKYQEKFLNVVEFLVDLGCDINAQVADRKNLLSEQYKKWGIAHFLMKFPSLKIISFFKSKIRDFNSPNSQGMTPLHLFCKNITSGSLLNSKLTMSNDYQGKNILEFLLANGLSPNCYDSNKALPFHYAASNCQLQFMTILRKYKSQVNFCTMSNETPLIEIVKRNNRFTQQQFQQLLTLGLDSNYQDMDKRNVLHHLVFNSTSLDSTPKLLKILLNHGCKINTLDKYDRSPIFYCFCEMQDQPAGEPLQKTMILQGLINNKDINLNLVDVYKRTILHYACERNHFFSIQYLLEKNINVQAQDSQENTPLAITLKTRNLDQAALLIQRGIRYGFVHEDKKKLSYFAYAFKNLSAGVCFMLLDHEYPIQKALEEIPHSGFKQTLIQKYIMK